MGGVAEVIGVEDDLVKVDPEDPTLLEHFGPPGDDSRPLKGDFSASVDGPGAGQDQAVGYRDDLAPQAAPGEKRIYGRTPEGVLAGELWIKGDGTVVLRSVLAPIGGKVEIAPDGSVDINGVVIDPLGGITTPASGDVKTGAGVSLNLHLHTSAAPGSPTSPPIPTP